MSQHPAIEGGKDVLRSTVRLRQRVEHHRHLRGMDPRLESVAHRVGDHEIRRPAFVGSMPQHVSAHVPERLEIPGDTKSGYLDPRIRDPAAVLAAHVRRIHLELPQPPSQFLPLFRLVVNPHGVVDQPSSFAFVFRGRRDTKPVDAALLGRRTDEVLLVVGETSIEKQLVDRCPALLHRPAEIVDQAGMLFGSDEIHALVAFREPAPLVVRIDDPELLIPDVQGAVRFDIG
jgi:hypothetical protein